MRSRCLLPVASLFSLLVLLKAQDVSGPGLSCVTSSPAGGQTRVWFVREDGAGARSLYSTLWSRRSQLLTCQVISDPRVTERYRSLCARNEARGREIDPKFNFDALLDPGGPCAHRSHLSAPKLSGRTEGKARSKRALLLPGTLWCGSGTRARGYDQLGMFEGADRCCREHDHCLHIIPAFTVNYGVFNSHLYTVSHCECDQRFRECLLAVNDSISSMVGYSFFNILQVPCFELKQQRRCTEMYWWGMCKLARVAPYAVFKNPLPYNTSDVTSKNAVADNGELFITEGPTISPHRKSSKTKHRCGFRDPPRGDTFHRRKTKGRGCKRRQKPSEAAPSQTPPTSVMLVTAPVMKIDLFNASKSSSAVSNARRAERNKSIRKSLSAYPTQRRDVTRNPSQIFSPTLPSILPLTQKPKFGPRPATAVESVTKRKNKHKKVPKPARGDTFQPHCKNCHEQETASHKTRSMQAKTTRSDFPTKQTTLENSPLKKKAETSKRHSLAVLSVAGSSAAPITTPSQKKGTRCLENQREKQVESNLMRNSTNQKPVGGNVTQSSHAARSLPWEDAPRNKAGQQLSCESLKLLDECEFKISPLGRKYNLQNWESKNLYHCDCTNRLAAEAESLKLTSIAASLLLDFVSQQCFTLPKEEKCLHRKSCSGSFTQASDLHEALKKMEKKDTAGVQNSNNARKRGIPVRLYKRCLRLKREADFMALNR